jgi:hypothetical protein
VLRVDLLDAKDLPAADRGGKSDPFALFTLNGNKAFKSDTKKKTLNPEWNEDFTTMIVCPYFSISSTLLTSFDSRLASGQTSRSKSLTGIRLGRRQVLEVVLSI